LNCDILGFLVKSKIASRCGFPLANLKNGPGRDFVPTSNLLNKLNLLYICSANQTNGRTKDILLGMVIIGRRS
jgi:hypothetical protein